MLDVEAAGLLLMAVFLLRVRLERPLWWGMLAITLNALPMLMLGIPVAGLIAILLALYSDRPAAEIDRTDAVALFEKLGLREHLTPQRSNGFRSMVERIKADAKNALATANA